MKLLFVFNFASHYRAPIYLLLDKEMGGDFVVGDIKTDVKEMDLMMLSHQVKRQKCVKLKNALYMYGKPKLIKTDYDTFLIGADVRDISNWLLLIRKVLFHRKKRVFGWGHGMLGKEGSLKQVVHKLFYNMMDGVFVYNERSRKLMINSGVSANKLHTVYNSLDYDRQLSLRKILIPSDIYYNHFRNTNKNIVFIGRLTKIKRFDILIDAVASLKENGKYVNVTFIGDGVERQNMEQIIAEKGISDQVWFYGACYDEKTNAELIYNADLCVSPGSIGLTAIHSMMFGCPVITNNDFNHQGPEFEAVKAGVTGAFFSAGDSSSLGDVISMWFNSHKEDREIIRNACYNEIDTKWNPHNQIRIFKEVIMSN